MVHQDRLAQRCACLRRRLGGSSPIELRARNCTSHRREENTLRYKWATGALAIFLMAGSGAATLQAQQSPPTADQGKNNAVDRDLMQKIRKSFMDDKTLSTSA